MTRDLFLLSTWMLGIVFTYIPYDPDNPVLVDWFIGSDSQILVVTYFYHCLEHIRWIVVCLALATKTNRRGEEVEYAYLFVVIGDFFDYLITFNDTWFSIWIVDITYNLFSTVYLSAVILWKHSKTV